MKNILLSLMMPLLFVGCFNAKPKCDDENVQLTLKSILDDDEWIYVEYGLSEQSLKALRLSTNGMDIRDFEVILSTDTLGVLRAHLKPMFDLKDYANEVVYTSFSGFTTQDNNNKKTSFCRASLKLTYPQMPDNMRKNYARGALKGIIFDGGEYETQISYSAQFSDDKKQVFVELLDH
ncbi:hypothetical protein CVU5213_07290 [Campylobacter vulpis]|uniref:Lipoprotein n=1 Tax=Campylobacter vulpis TaxID=1655500 RepID=A0A2G4R8I7_9BACT|nr:hypothetical protein [Campylobacter vulpis]MBS4236210.1 hypothetical protein [Campylobacter vulpis]MBS4241519.1 hypothetical protein [Campylobacter vulpis]MBS4269695.1 hypothetical protein [Campylobacter vulpis]MBS4282017.1 hypothetical protein [Campylobacter vulpis]MBS4331885.1 hypothetical protein [Campylobacter vulpis]